MYLVLRSRVTFACVDMFNTLRLGVGDTRLIYIMIYCSVTAFKRYLFLLVFAIYDSVTVLTLFVLIGACYLW